MTDKPCKSKITQQPFPADPNERLNAILSAINTEPKSILIAKCLDDKVFRYQSELGAEYRRWADWPQRACNFAVYSHHTLVPIGLVAEEEVTISAEPLEVEVSWRLSPEGWKYGSPAAAAALRLACEQGLSLYQVFGKTGSPSESRPPGNAATILKALEQGRSRNVELADAARLDETGVLVHLLRLKKAGLVTYDSVNPEESGWAMYTWVEGKDYKKAPTCKSYPTLTKAVAEELARQGISNYNNLARVLKYSHPKRISSILSHLADQGFAKPSWVSVKRMSDARLTERGRCFVHFVYNLEEAMAGGPSLGRMEQELYSLGPEITYKAAEFYRQVSPKRNAKGFEHWTGLILDFVDSYSASHGRGPRPVEVEQGIGYKGVIAYLTPLVKAGTLAKERDGHEVRYRRVC